MTKTCLLARVENFEMIHAVHKKCVSGSLCVCVANDDFRTTSSYLRLRKKVGKNYNFICVNDRMPKNPFFFFFFYYKWWWRSERKDIFSLCLSKLVSGACVTGVMKNGGPADTKQLKWQLAWNNRRFNRIGFEFPIIKKNNWIDG